ncbi:glycoside hydrolase [Delitschia confertaspora ATCC 74209]|uniref:Glycoside hydrolase n=1 Tax=Delitschia confertaspora ATCC 74209 TaxID=1513339 RepID=A0A9P4MTA3_9PLEO|nr:glycoside hydrolase [Delitschia confertaspora ATCC 74209]
MKNFDKSFVLVGLAALAAAHPHKIYGHNHLHGKHDKRAFVTATAYTTVTAAEVIVWADNNGAPYKTETVEVTTALESSTVLTISAVTSGAETSVVVTILTVTPSAETPALTVTTSSVTGSSITAQGSSSTMITTSATVSEVAVSSANSVSSPSATSSATISSSETSTSVVSSSAVAPVPTSIVGSSAYAAPALSTQSQATASTTPGSTPSASMPGPQKAQESGMPLGVAWDAFYRASNGSAECKTPEMVTSDFNTMNDLGFKVVRTYGSGCDQVARALPAALENGQKLILGIYSPQESISQSVQIFSDAIKQHAGGSWDSIVLVTVENERVNAHELTVARIVDLIDQTRSALAGVGYNGPVGAVETVPALVSNPALCENSDYALANIHAFFDGKVTPNDAGTFVLNEVARVAEACPNKRIIVMESGWPYQGSTNNKAVPSRDNQKAAINSIRQAFDQDLILFSAFNSDWKTDQPETFAAEKYWGFVS